MNPEVRQLWVDALRSGDYQRGERRLCTYATPVKSEDNTAAYCCLGVLSELAAARGIVERTFFYGVGGYRSPSESDDQVEASYLHPLIMSWAGLTVKNPGIDGNAASTWNDDYHTSFVDLADMIEEHL